MLKYSKINFYEKSVNKSDGRKSAAESLVFLSPEEHKATAFYKAECGEEYKKRFSRNDLCAALLASEGQGNTVNVSWVTDKPLFIDEIEMVLPNDGIIIYDVITKPEERGKGYYSKTLDLITEWAAIQGYNKITIYSEEKNKSSIKGIVKSGFKYTKSMRMLKVDLYIVNRFKLYF